MIVNLYAIAVGFFLLRHLFGDRFTVNTNVGLDCPPWLSSPTPLTCLCAKCNICFPHSRLNRLIVGLFVCVLVTGAYSIRVPG